MKKSSFALKASATIIGVIAGLVGSPAEAHSPETPGKEKCYGIAKAGKNDCGWSGGSCMGSSKTEANKEAWISVPVGLCSKIANGSLEPIAPKSSTQERAIPGGAAGKRDFN